MKLLKNTKNGSYIVEAVIVIPIFIVAVVMLMSIVPIIASCENVNFATADELHMECTKSAFRNNPAALPVALHRRVSGENRKLNDYHISLYRYLYSRKNIDDLISVHFHAEFKEKNPIGLFSSVDYSGKVTARAFTGTLRKDVPETGKNTHIVYIFPEWGKRYHNKNCTYVKANCQLVSLSQELKKHYDPCRLCGAKAAATGSMVFCFWVSGEAYHLAGCRIIDKYYIEIEQGEAEQKGYSPCSKCGGV